MKNFKNLLFIALFFITAIVLGQTKITGIIVDETNQSMPGASILEKGTANGTETDFNGKFTLVAKSKSGVIVISYVGYKTREFSFNPDNTNLGKIKLVAQNELDEIVITSGVIDIAKVRETPVAVSTITARDIELKVGNQEFPEIMNSTPGVYATKQGGGYGDSRISLRGFNQSNTSFLINGQPVNDMENGWVYWSNWQGLTDVASGIQIQRGIGASRLAVPSVGGTVSIFTKAAQKTKGASVSQTFGNDGYSKTAATYNSGKNEKGWAYSFLLSRWQGDGYIYGTQGEGTTDFAAIGYEPEGSNHALNLTVLGASQWHHQRSTWVSIRDYQNFGSDHKEGIDRRWSSDAGFLNGEEYNMRRNFYNKPLATFNWDWQISDNLKLNTSAYASAGRGGGTGPRGGNFRKQEIDNFPFRIDLTEHYTNRNRGTRDANGFINFNAVVASNQAVGPYTGSISAFQGQSIGSNGFLNDGVSREVLIRRASMNSHDWVGAISNLEGEFGKFKASIGVDLRSYKGYHYRVLNDLLGLDAYYSTGNRNSAGQIINTTVAASPFNDTGIRGPKIDYYNNGIVGWQGFNGMVEYNDDKKFTAVFQFGISNQSFQREDFFDQPAQPISDTQNQTGGYVKGGANYNLDNKSNVFFNLGRISRQPLFDAVFPNFSNTINTDLENEEITSFEIGYGFSNDKLSFNINAYATTWGNRFETATLPNLAGDDGTAQFRNIDVQHNGIEFEGTYQALSNLKLRGMLSIGDWRYTKDFTSTLFDANQNVIGEGTLYLKDAKVGDAAQFTANLMADYRIGKANIDVSYRFADQLYADYNIVDDVFTTPNNEGAVQLPSYGLVDAGVTYRLKLFGNDTTIRLNINNLFDTVYIAESETNIHSSAGSQTWNGIDVNNSVWFGFGRTWNASVRYNF
jgi:outer membrane receptor protein involved in Fe transport